MVKTTIYFTPTAKTFCRSIECHVSIAPDKPPNSHLFKNSKPECFCLGIENESPASNIKVSKFFSFKLNAVTEPEGPEPITIFSKKDFYYLG